MTDVMAINQSTGQICMDDGSVIQASVFLDFEGDEIDNPENAEFMIGQMPDGMWLSVDCSCFEHKRLS